MSFVSSYNGGSVMISACISNYNAMKMKIVQLVQNVAARYQKHDPMLSQVGPHTIT